MLQLFALTSVTREKKDFTTLATGVYWLHGLDQGCWDIAQSLGWRWRRFSNQLFDRQEFSGFSFYFVSRLTHYMSKAYLEGIFVFYFVVLWEVNFLQSFFGCLDCKCLFSSHDHPRDRAPLYKQDINYFLNQTSLSHKSLVYKPTVKLKIERVMPMKLLTCV